MIPSNFPISKTTALFVLLLYLPTLASALQTDLPQINATETVTSNNPTTLLEQGTTESVSSEGTKPTEVRAEVSTAAETKTDATINATLPVETMQPTTVKNVGTTESTMEPTSQTGTVTTTTIKSTVMQPENDNALKPTLISNETSDLSTTETQAKTTLGPTTLSQTVTAESTAASHATETALSSTTQTMKIDSTTSLVVDVSKPVTTDATDEENNKTETATSEGEEKADEAQSADNEQQCILDANFRCKGEKMVCWGGGVVDCTLPAEDVNSNEKEPKNQPKRCIMSKTLRCNINVEQMDCQGKSTCEPITNKIVQEQPLRYWEVAIIAAFTAAAGVTVIAVITAVYISWTKLKVNPETNGNIGAVQA